MPRELNIQEINNYIGYNVKHRLYKNIHGKIQGIIPGRNNNDYSVKIETDKSILNIRSYKLYRDYMFVDNNQKLIGVK